MKSLHLLFTVCFLFVNNLNAGLLTETFELAIKFVDDIAQVSGKTLSRASKRTFALNADKLMPMVKKYGIDVLKLEAKAPGLSSAVMMVAGPKYIKMFALKVPKKETTRLLGFAERVKTPKAKTLLFKAYADKGSKFLKHLDAKRILAYGLTTTMVIAAYRTSGGVKDLLEKTGDGVKENLKNNPNALAACRTLCPKAAS